MALNRIPYRTSLRVLGRLLNGAKARHVTVCEIDQGFLLYYFEGGDPGRAHNRAVHGAEVMDLDDILRGQRGKPEPTGSFKALQSIFGFRQSEALKFQRSHPLCPMGYENVLRSLGDALDRRQAQAVLIAELDDCLYVEYTVDRADFVVRNGQRMALAGRREERYTAQQIVKLVEDAREQTAESIRRNGHTLSLNPMDIAAYCEAARILEDEGQHGEAEELYRAAVGLMPKHAEAHFHLARHARRRGDHKGALKSLQHAIDLRDDDARFFHLLGRLNVDRRHDEAAITALRRAAELDPGNTIYQFDLGQLLERLGRTDEAHAVLMGGHARGGAAQHALSDAVEALWAGVVPLDPAPPAAGSQPVSMPAPAPPAAPVPVPVAAYDADPPHLARRSLAERAAGLTEATLAGGARDETAFELAGRAAPDAAGAHASMPPAALPPARVAGPLRQAEFAPERGGDELPVLGVALSQEWTATSLPPVHVPADSATAAAALPLIGVEQPGASWPVEPATAAPAPMGLPDLPAADATSEDAVQLAAAILRVEEQVRAEPQRADLHRKLGFLLAKQGRSEEAAAEFRRAVECGRRRLA